MNHDPQKLKRIPRMQVGVGAVPLDLMEQLDIFCAKHDTSRSSVLRAALEEYIDFTPEDCHTRPQLAILTKLHGGNMNQEFDLGQGRRAIFKWMGGGYPQMRLTDEEGFEETYHMPWPPVYTRWRAETLIYEQWPDLLGEAYEPAGPQSDAFDSELERQIKRSLVPVESAAA